MSDQHHGPLHEIEDTLVEFERRIVRLGRLEVPLPRRRTVLIAAMVVALLAVGGVLVLTRTAVTKQLVLPVVGRHLAADLSADALVIEPDGVLRLRKVEARVPGLKGEAGRFFAAERAAIDIDWGALLRGSVRVERVVLEAPVVRVSQSTRTGRLNVAGLAVLSAGAGAAPSALPELETTGAIIEIAEHDDERMQVLKRLRVDGAVRAVEGEGGGYLIELVEVQPEEGRSPLVIQGVFGAQGLTLSMDRVALADWGPDVAPSAVRGLWARMDVRGSVSETRFTYGLDGTVLAEMLVDGVELSLPLGEADEGGEPNWARMSGVSGVVRLFTDRVQADLRGTLADVPYDVAISWDGTSLDSPFIATLESRGFRLEKRPQFLPFAPEVVQRRLRSFGNPTALVDARVRVVRAADEAGVLGPVRYEGVLSFRDGVAAYEHFPYRFRGLTGTIRFNNEELVIDGITGHAPSGARLTATGRIWPPAPGAQVDLHIVATGVPLDATLEAALGEQRRPILRTLFSTAAYEELIALGLIADPAEVRAAMAQRDRLRERMTGADPASVERIQQRLAALEDEPTAPPFALGGLGDVDVRILRAPGDDSEWERHITVHLPRAGIVPEHFPLPIDAQDVTIVIENDTARLEGGVYRALGGGEARISADVFLGDEKRGEPGMLPDLRVEAWDVAVDERLLHAIPDVGRDGRGRSAGQLLAELGVEGTVACTARIAARPGGERLGFDVTVRADGLRASPRTGDGSLSFESLTGTVEVSERQVRVNLAGDLHHNRDLPDPVVGLRPAGRLAIDGRLDFTPDAPGRLWARVTGEGVDLAGPLEDAVEVFSPASAQAVRDGRARWSPEGSSDLEALVRGELGGVLDARLTLRNVRRLAFDAMGGRVELGESRGTITAGVGGAPFVAFNEFETDMVYRGEAAGRLRASGDLPLGEASDHGEDAARMRLELDLAGARLESPFVAWLASNRMGPGLAGAWARHRPRGLFDASVGLWPRLEAAAEGGPIPFGLDGLIRPRTLTLDAGGREVHFHTVEGVVEFDQAGGAVAGLVAQAEGWTARGDARWSLPEDGTLILAGEGDIEANGLRESLQAVLPKPVRALLESLEVRADGPVRVEGLVASATRAPGGEEWSYDAAGGVRFEDASAEVGVAVRDADGSVEFVASRAVGASPEFDVRIIADRALAAGVETTNARVRLMNGDQPREVLVPLISADCHGGRFAGEAVLLPEGPAPDAPLRYAATLNASGVQLAPVLEDLARSIGPQTAAPRRDDGDFDAPASDRSRGLADAELGVSGTLGRPETRRGRGTVQIAGGRVLSLPGVVPLIEVSNLQLPAGEQLDYARASFYLDDERVNFEDLSVYSSSIEILGYGTMTWPDRVLDLRFNSRAARRIPVVSDVLEGIRDELISTQVEGPLDDYEIKVVQLSGTRALLGRVLGAEDSEQDQRLRHLQRRAAEERERMSRPVPRTPVEGG